MVEEPKKEEVVNQAVKSEETQIDVAQLAQRLEQLEQTNERLLNESKKYKESYRTLRTEVEEREKAKLEESENWKELLDIEKNKRSQYEQQLNETKKQILRKELNFQVAAHAKDAFDVNDIIKSIPSDMVSVDEDNLSVSGVKEAVAFLKEKKPYLFDTKKTHGMISGKPVGESGRVDYSQLTKEEQDAEFKKALLSSM